MPPAKGRSSNSCAKSSRRHPRANRARREHLTPAGFTGDTLVLEVNLVGYIGALPTIVDRGSLSQTSPSRRFRFDDVENYTAVGVEARQVVDGVPNSTAIPAAFQFQLFGLFWS